VEAGIAAEAGITGEAAIAVVAWQWAAASRVVVAVAADRAGRAFLRISSST
jgi:hypothetical protein